MRDESLTCSTKIFFFLRFFLFSQFDTRTIQKNVRWARKVVRKILCPNQRNAEYDFGEQCKRISANVFVYVGACD